MAETPKLNHPWLVAVWPGMGQVAVSAGYYLMAKLGVHLLSEFSPRELFDIEHVEVKNGLVQAGKLPQSRFFLWTDPAGQRDIVIFVGEAQPPLGKAAFCRRVLDYARQLGIERIFTFAAFATQMHPQSQPQVFAAATTPRTLKELSGRHLHLLEEGYISGLNGVLLGAAVEAGMEGICLLGEMPQLFAQIPFPAASLAVLRAFRDLAEIELDVSELTAQVETMNEQLSEVLAALGQHEEEDMDTDGDSEEEEVPPEFAPVESEPVLSEEEEKHIEELFDRAQRDRTHAYELKRQLDRLHVFPRYEDRFLDLFQKRD